MKKMQEVKMPSKTKEMVEHLGHVKYPITGKEFMAACSNMSDATKEQKEWVKKNISMNKTYKSADEVKKALKL
jgi:hypothetical protein